MHFCQDCGFGGREFFLEALLDRLSVVIGPGVELEELIKQNIAEEISHQRDVFVKKDH